MQYVLGGLAILFIIGGGWWFTNNQGTDQQLSSTTETEMLEEKMEMEERMDGGAMMDSEKMLNEDEEMMDTDTEVQVMNKSTGGYFPYNAEAVSNSAADTIVLSFSATWCPSCRAFDADVTKNLNAVPESVEIFKVDYDTNVALRQKYGVTTQHTFVQIKSDGTQIKKWTGGNTLASVLAQI
jgi:thiol-disulfide isomerase/thioredoxin